MVNWKLEFQNISSVSYDRNAEIMFTPAPDLKTTGQYGKSCNFCRNFNHFVSKCFRKQQKDAGRKGYSSFSWANLPVKPTFQYFRASQKEIHPNEHPSSQPPNY